MSRQRPELDFRFTLTLPEDWPQVQGILARARELGVEGYLNNLGKVAVTDTPDLYARSHLCFLPSLLEVFSAVYPECLCTGVPLVTTDMRFSRDICQDAAAYYRPGDARSAAGQIIELAENEQAWRRISERGREVYAALPDAAGKWELQKAMVQEAAGRS